MRATPPAKKLTTVLLMTCAMGAVYYMMRTDARAAMPHLRKGLRNLKSWGEELPKEVGKHVTDGRKQVAEQLEKGTGK